MAKSPTTAMLLAGTGTAYISVYENNQRGTRVGPGGLGYGEDRTRRNLPSERVLQPMVA